MNISTRLVMAAAVAAVSACTGPNHTTGVLAELVATGDLGLPHSGLPPLFTGCARYQPGYDPGDPSAEPPIPPTLNGLPYSLTDDGFCTLSWTRRLSLGADGYARMDDHIYLVEMGEPDPARTLPPHLEDLREQLASGDGAAHYCHFRWRVDAEPFEDYPETDVQLLTLTLEEVSYYCSTEYIPDVVYVPGYAQQEVAIRSTDPDIFVSMATNMVADWNGGYRFHGYSGLPDTGGAATWGQTAGWMEYYEACELGPAAGGPGVCPTECRLFSPNADGTIRQCTFDDVGALPANPAILEPTWIDEYRDIYDRVFGG